MGGDRCLTRNVGRRGIGGKESEWSWGYGIQRGEVNRSRPRVRREE